MTPELEHAFRTLGVRPGAPTIDVQSAYRQLIRAHHPDHAGADVVAATRRLAEINAAKDLIDRNPAPQPIRVAGPPHVADPNAAPNTPNASDPRKAANLRARREAEARAFRKAMEARATADQPAQAAAPISQSHAQTSAHAAARQEADEDARRRRQAVFEAVMSGKDPSGKSSLLGRLRTLAAR